MQAQIIIEYIKDVSSMLCLISAVREKCFERHLAAERMLIPKCVALDHVNYSRYLAFQHVNLDNVKRRNKPAWDELIENGFGGSISGQPFLTIHGDLITGTPINREVKVRGGPMQSGYSTTDRTTDSFIKTSHLMTSIRAKLKDRLAVMTESVHKEITVGARVKHECTVSGLVTQLDQYFNPFVDGPARHMKTGTGNSRSFIFYRKGESQYTMFANTRLKATEETRVDFFHPIKKMNLKTGMEKSHIVAKAVDILKEDRQAFGFLVGKSTSPQDAHSHPLTSVPLALATPQKDLIQGSKACFRNFLIDESNSISESFPKESN